MSGYVYDTGALIAGERGERAVWALHRRILEQGLRPTVPVTVLAQAWRDGPQAQLSRLLAGCDVRDLTEKHARLVGKVLRDTSTSDIVDASVVVIAQSRAEHVITSDPSDLNLIADALGRPRVVIRSINDL